MTRQSMNKSTNSNFWELLPIFYFFEGDIPFQFCNTCHFFVTNGILVYKVESSVWEEYRKKQVENFQSEIFQPVVT